MNTSLSWLKAYVPELSCTPQEFTDAMTLTGTKVEGYACMDADLDRIVVGKILQIAPHPDADKLIVCQVQVAKDGAPVQIVTGAKNVSEGDLVPVVLDGGRVAGGHDGKKTPGGIKIKKGKLRGVESCGMMCSIEELGSSKEMYPEAPEDGIYLFQKELYPNVQIGDDAVEVLGLRDVNFEFEITSNRVDCFSVLGIAREAAATFRKPFCPPKGRKTGKLGNASDEISVEILAPELCSRYVARVVKNIRLAPSPLWMQRRLASCGIRPINNIVDITNYVMEEYGQPMHAYDLDTIAGHKIVVRRAQDGEKFETLDGQVREVDSTMLMIADGEKAVGIAGIMGGENSKITDNVQTLLFEAACFDGTNIRLSGKKLGMRTEAQAKFEKGLDPNTTMEAINRACELIEELDAGDVVCGCVDVYPAKKEAWRVPFSYERTNQVLGTSIDKETMLSYFEMVDLAYDAATDEVIVPTWRGDVLSQADLDEEVARFYGYDKIPVTLPSGEAMTGKKNMAHRVEDLGREVAEHYGFSEAMTYSFESPKVFDRLCLAPDDKLRQTVTISNPLGEDFSIMRTLPVNGILTSLSLNASRRNKNVRLYEMATIYLPKQLPLRELPDERRQFVLGFYGDGDFFEMKGVLEDFLRKAGLKAQITYDPAGGKTFLHPGRQAKVLYKGKEMGYLGELHPEVADNYDISERVYLAVLDLPEILPLATFDIQYEGIAKFPVVTRDLSILMKKEVLAGQVEEVIRKNAGALLEGCELFDVYEGAQIRPGYKSMAYSIRLQAKDHTLTEEEITDVMNRILKGLGKLGVELRS